MLDERLERLEVTGGVEEALEENTAKVDHLVDTEKTADAINAFSFERVTNAARPLLAKRPKDEEPCTSDETLEAKER